MKLDFLLVAMLAGAGVAQFTPAQQPRVNPNNQVSLCVTTAIGSCGTLCEPFDCKPNYTLVSSYEVMYFDVTSAPGNFYALFAGEAVPGCLPIPGIEGALAVWNPAMVLRFGVVYDSMHRPDLPCAPSHDQWQLDVPAIAPGYDVRFQVLGMDGFARTAPALSFSRATEVRTR